MKMLSKVLLLLVLFNVAATRSLPGSLVELKHSQQEVYGRYESRDGRGIAFLSQADGLLRVSTLDGKIIINTEVDEEQKFRSIHVLDHKYLQHSNRARPDEPVEHDHPFSHSIKKLLEVQEIALLQEATEAVNQRGLTGRNTPAALPFFMFALRVTQLHLSPSVSNTTTTIRKRRDVDVCSGQCPPCVDDDCYGLCGYGCYCWTYVCGDCCWHQGCFGHDTCCRTDFYQTSCLVPYYFHCDESYAC